MLRICKNGLATTEGTMPLPRQDHNPWALASWMGTERMAYTQLHTNWRACAPAIQGWIHQPNIPPLGAYTIAGEVDQEQDKSQQSATAPQHNRHLQEDEADEKYDFDNNTTQGILEIEEGNVAGTDPTIFNSNDLNINLDNLAHVEEILLDDGNDAMSDYDDDLTGDDISELSISSPVLCQQKRPLMDTMDTGSQASNKCSHTTDQCK